MPTRSHGSPGRSAPKAAVMKEVILLSIRGVTIREEIFCCGRVSFTYPRSAREKYERFLTLPSPSQIPLEAFRESSADRPPITREPFAHCGTCRVPRRAPPTGRAPPVARGAYAARFDKASRLFDGCNASSLRSLRRTLMRRPRGLFLRAPVCSRGTLLPSSRGGDS